MSYLLKNLAFMIVCTVPLAAQTPLITVEEIEKQEANAIIFRREVAHRYNVPLLTRNVLEDLGKNLEREFNVRYCHVNLEVEGNNIMRVGYDLVVSQGYYTLDKARTLLKDVSYEILTSLQNKEILRPFFPIYPLPTNLLDISIRFVPSDCNNYPFPGNVGYLTLLDNKIHYDSVTPETYNLHTYFEEQLVLPPRYL